MKKEIELTAWKITLFVLIGTLIRMCYCYYSKTWLETPDQLAWQLAIDEMYSSNTFSYKQFIHYPYLGGSFIFGLMALLLKPFDWYIPSLSLAALIIDSVIRFVQIIFAKRIFGANTAIWFAFWTVFSIPLLLPLSFIIYGIHYASAFIPFLFLSCICRKKEVNPIWLGIITGLSLAISYNNIAILLMYVCWIIYNQGINRTSVIILGKYSFFILIGFMPHILLRTLVDNGFNLEVSSSTHVREYSISDFFSFAGLKHLLGVWIKPFPSAFLLFKGQAIIRYIGWLIAGIFLYGGLFSFWKSGILNSQPTRPALFLIISFIIIYALSPFYESSTSGTYYQYRHLAYIIPFVVVFLIHAYLSIPKLGNIFISTWILFSIIFSILYIVNTKPEIEPASRQQGWIIGRKFGEDAAKLTNMLNLVPPKQRGEVSIGIGWGVTATILSNKSKTDTLSINKLISVYNTFPSNQKRLFILGIDTAFAPGITPVLHPDLLTTLKMSIR